MKLGITITYFLFLAFHIGLSELGLMTPLQVLTKVTLMPLLFLGIWRFASASQLKYWVMVGVVFSWAGDVLLAFDHLYPVLFIFGLGSFLIAHFAYIKVFSSNFSSIQFWKKSSLQQAMIAILLIGFAIWYFTFLLPHLDSMAIPVCAYVITITVMALAALYRKGKTTSQSFRFIFLGALCFMVSDSLLAYNKFIIDLPYATFLVMSTYGVAQWCIASGVVKSS